MTKQDLLKTIDASVRGQSFDDDWIEALVGGKIVVHSPRSQRETLIWQKVAEEQRTDDSLETVGYTRWLVNELRRIGKFEAEVRRLAEKFFPEQNYRFEEHLTSWKQEVADYLRSKLDTIIDDLFETTRLYNSIKRGETRLGEFGGRFFGVTEKVEVALPVVPDREPLKREGEA